MVQISERYSVVGNRPLTLAVAECWVRTAEIVGRSAMEGVMRSVTKIIRLKSEIIELASLPEDELETVVLQAFDVALE